MRLFVLWRGFRFDGVHFRRLRKAFIFVLLLIDWALRISGKGVNPFKIGGKEKYSQFVCYTLIRLSYSYNKTNYMHQFLKFIFGIKLYMFRTVSLSIIRSFSLYTRQWYLCWQLASRIRTERQLSAQIPLPCVQWKTPDDGQRNCPKHVEFYSKNKFEKLVHLVCFIIRICHDARSPERQIRPHLLEPSTICKGPCNGAWRHVRLDGQLLYLLCDRLRDKAQSFALWYGNWWPKVTDYTKLSNSVLGVKDSNQIKANDAGIALTCCEIVWQTIV